jgi:hypothetical protein
MESRMDSLDGNGPIVNKGCLLSTEDCIQDGYENQEYPRGKNLVFDNIDIRHNA